MSLQILNDCESSIFKDTLNKQISYIDHRLQTIKIEF